MVRPVKYVKFDFMCGQMVTIKGLNIDGLVDSRCENVDGSQSYYVIVADKEHLTDWWHSGLLVDSGWNGTPLAGDNESDGEDNPQPVPFKDANPEDV